MKCYEEIFNDHHLLMANFWKEVTVSFKSRKFSIVPGALYDNNNPEVFLNINVTFDPDAETLQVSSLDDLGIKVIYAVETHLLNHISSVYPRAGFKSIHQCEALIYGLKKLLQPTPGNYHCLFIDRFTLHQIVFKNNLLSYYNLFPINKFEDYFRYISIVAEDQKLDFHRDKIILWGFLGSQSNHFEEFKKRYPGLELGQRPRELYLGYVFDDIPTHQYFDLLSLNLF
jgi:hypothetical protein